MKSKLRYLDLIPTKLYESHQEYFPLLAGQRVNGYIQRCLTNPEVLRLAIDGVLRWIGKQPAAKGSRSKPGKRPIWSARENSATDFTNQKQPPLHKMHETIWARHGGGCTNGIL